MADNLNITAGTGTTIATDDVGGAHYQKVKLVDATADSSTGTGIAANPLQVSLANHGSNATAVKVDNSAVTQPISVASLPLPSGAATAAKQPALGTAGTPSADVISVQGITSMTALKVDGSAVTQPVSISAAVATNSTLQAGSAIVGKVGIDQTTPGTTNLVQVGGSLPAGTNGIGKLTSNSGVTIGAVEIAATQTLSTVTTVGTVTTVSTLTGGGIAHDSADSGNPIKVGAKAIAALSGATLVAAADRTDAQADLDGALIVRNNYALGDLVSGNASNTDGTSTTVLSAGAAGVKHYITDVTLSNTSASNIYVELKDGTTAKWTFPVPAGGGVTHHFASPLGGTAATAWNFDPSAATSTVYCSVSGFKSKI